ncbi:MAG: DUF2059 domain-containing protein [Chlamydiia bacterium]|nr:DUF2059 domain-containing protein [Chlamydiia bacterium]
MKQLKGWILMAVVAPALMLSAEEAEWNAAQELLDVVQFEKLIDSSIDQSVDMIKHMQPELAKVEVTLRKFFSDVLDSETLRKEVAEMYEKTFTEHELKSITAFYLTDSGQKALEKMPKLMEESMLLMQKRISENSHKLQEMIVEAMQNGS